MRLTTVLPAAAALVGGYVLGAAAGRDRYRQITTSAYALLHQPRLQQLLFDLAGLASSKAARVPGPAADLVDAAATRMQETLTQPDEPDSPRPAVAPDSRS